MAHRRLKASGLGSGARASYRKKGRSQGLSHRGGSGDDGTPAIDPEERDWEYPRSQLSDLRQVGQGNFGVVYIGKAKGLVPGERESRVAVKTLMLEDDDDDDAGKEACRKEFLSEVKIMKAVSTCENVVRLLGVCTEEQPYYMVMEFMSKGDLKDVLRASRPKTSRPTPFGLRTMALMGANIAAGMHYLGAKGVVHRDLAARNCMVGERYLVKVGDFGLTRKTYASEYYRMKHSQPLPIRWMAFECLMDGKFTALSDLWSFGIVLWEIFSLGKMPYDEYENAEVVEQVCENDYRMPAPSLSPAGLHTMMLQCWEEEEEDRGTFEDCRAQLTSMADRLDDGAITREMWKGRAPVPASAAEEEAEDDDGDDAAAGYDNTADAAGDAAESAYEEPVVRAGNGLLKKLALGPAVDQKSVAAWVAATTGRPVDGSNLHASLKDGQTLCVLMNTLVKGSIRRFSTGRKLNAVKQMTNIDKFITKATEQFGLEMFDVSDLFDDEDMLRVVACLAELRDAVAGAS